MTCIVGYVGQRNAVVALMELMCRAKGSCNGAGIATSNARGDLVVSRAHGNLSRLNDLLSPGHAGCTCGIGQLFRSGPLYRLSSGVNPQYGGNRELALVYEGLLSNCKQLRDRLEAEGYCFHSLGPSEVAAHLVHFDYERVRLSQVHKMAGSNTVFQVSLGLKCSLPQLAGGFVMAAMYTGMPMTIFASHRDRCIFCEHFDDEIYFSSDPTLLPAAGRVMPLPSNHVVVLSSNSIITEVASIR